MTVNGIEAAKMLPVVIMPHSGLPEAISNTEPTAAIAEIEAPSKQTPAIGVYIVLCSCFDILDVLAREALFLEFFGECEFVVNAIDE